MKKLKEKLNAKLSKNGGFTLVEMLIVVAIIAILVVVSVPIIGSSLDNAKTAADNANERAAVGVATVAYLQATKTNTDASITTGIGTDGGTGYYIITKGQGKLVKKGSSEITADTFEYGKSSTGGHAGNGIAVTLKADGTLEKVEWVALGAATTV